MIFTFAGTSFPGKEGFVAILPRMSLCFKVCALVLVIPDNTLGKCYYKRSVSNSLLWQGDLEGVLLHIYYGIEILWHIETPL